jgi:hypothetical protein
MCLIIYISTLKRRNFYRLTASWQGVPLNNSTSHEKACLRRELLNYQQHSKRTAKVGTEYRLIISAALVCYAAAAEARVGMEKQDL